MTLTIRPAQPGDVSMAAQLLWDTLGEFGDAFFGLGDHRLALDALTWFFTREDNRLGYHLCRIAEQNGQAVGLLLSFPGITLWKWQVPLAWLIPRYYGVTAAIHLLLKSIPLWFFKEMDRSEYYIAHLAVAAGYRGQGIGRALLLEAELLARENRLNRCSLLVDLDNPDARRLYERMGYRTVDIHHAGKYELRSLRSPGSERMVKLLDQ